MEWSFGFQYPKPDLTLRHERKSRLAGITKLFDTGNSINRIQIAVSAWHTDGHNIVILLYQYSLHFSDVVVKMHSK